jgi:M6 family metalloprotease-like protein
VRISFETNRDPHLVTMAPDGDFFLDPHDPDDPLPIDPTPHDKAYFESHLVGLGEYYKYQSGGRCTSKRRCLPEGDRDSYKLGDVADYGPGDTGFWTLNGLERLVRDMITAADQGTQADGSADLSDYADDRDLTYIIFAHAGSDWQSDINQDTPNDIPTFFVTLGEAQGLIGGGLLSECSVIPETTTQDGYRGSIAAALYHEFGHALGLPDVYDATTGLTSCGVWDLMDSGTNLAATLGYRDPDTGQIVAEPVSGILPPSLSAWCKLVPRLAGHPGDRGRRGPGVRTAGGRRTARPVWPAQHDPRLRFLARGAAGPDRRGLAARVLPDREPLGAARSTTRPTIPTTRTATTAASTSRPIRRPAWSSTWPATGGHDRPEHRLLRLLPARRRPAGLARQHGPHRTEPRDNRSTASATA